MPQLGIPDIVVGRLPIYLRALNFLAAEGREITSSQELGDRLGISSAQIRKDLSHFGEFGKQGTGYEIQFLREQLLRILQVGQVWDVVLVGAGDLGNALVHYSGFEGRGFRIVAVFDNKPAKIGEKLGNLTIQGIDQLGDLVRGNGIQMAIIATPASSAQIVVDALVNAGIRAILNYAPITVSVPSGVRVQYIDPVAHLQRMTFYL
ncbi:MAG: redox-sensing transcriptional repressor Rex [Anaerolineae bacterium]|nr:MAG: redox-sensing transcriptional repressor Rex [Anaerolineae bacterium]